MESKKYIRLSDLAYCPVCEKEVKTTSEIKKNTELYLICSICKHQEFQYMTGKEYKSTYQKF